MIKFSHPQDEVSINFTVRPIMGQIAGMLLFGKYIKHDDNTALGKMLNSIHDAGHLSTLYLLSCWDSLDQWGPQVLEANQTFADSIGGLSDGDQERAMLAGAVGSFVEDCGGVFGLQSLVKQIDDYRKTKAIEQVEYTPPTLDLGAMIPEPLMATDDCVHIPVGKTEDGKQIDGYGFKGSSVEEMEQMIARMEADGVQFVEIWNEDQLNALEDFPEEARDKMRQLIRSGRVKLPIKLGKTERKDGEKAFDSGKYTRKIN